MFLVHPVCIYTHMYVHYRYLHRYINCVARAWLRNRLAAGEAPRRGSWKGDPEQEGPGVLKVSRWREGAPQLVGGVREGGKGGPWGSWLWKA